MSRNNPFTREIEQNLNTSGQFNAVTKSQDTVGSRIMYPAKVISIDNSNGMRRIVARIIQVDTDGTEAPGKDRNLSDEELVTCVPLMPSHFNVMPAPGEMVILFLENFAEGNQNGGRYYIGPIRTTYYNFSYEDFASANKIKDYQATNISIPQSVLDLVPDSNDVVVQGKNNADIVLSDTRIRINVSKFDGNTLTPDTETFGQLEAIRNSDVKEYLNKNRIMGTSIPNPIPDPEPITQINLRANNINLIATDGANKDITQNGDVDIFIIQDSKASSTTIKYDLEVENNPSIFKFGQEAESLHPIPFGDELILLLSKIIVRLETHIHTPQKPALTDSAGLQKDLLQYTIDQNGNINKLANLISQLVRTN